MWYRVEFQWAGTEFTDYWTPWRIDGMNTLPNRPDINFLTKEEVDTAVKEIKESEETLIYRVYEINMSLVDEGSSR